MQKLINRIFKKPGRSFFLFGPRGTGKSTWLKQEFKDSPYIDLLKSSLYLELSQNPSRLEAIIGNASEKSWIVIDEIQKIPELLDEVHRLIEGRKWNFALSGSSARKLKRKGVNLLAGRAISRHFYPFSAIELGENFELNFSLEYGMLPLVQTSKSEANDLLSSYVETYIKEEIREEGIIRKLLPFLRFIGVAGILNGQVINALNISREAGVPRSNVDSYFSILLDTLLGTFLPAYRPNFKVREQVHQKFYWFDPGVARATAGLLAQPADRLWLDVALETLVLNELKIYNQLSGKNYPIFYYKTASGMEIDFVIETRKKYHQTKPQIVCIEIKLSEKWKNEWEKPIRSLSKEEKIDVMKMVGVYTGEQKYVFDDFYVFPFYKFVESLYAGEIF